MVLIYLYFKTLAKNHISGAITISRIERIKKEKQVHFFQQPAASPAVCETSSPVSIKHAPLPDSAMALAVCLSCKVAMSLWQTAWWLREMWGKSHSPSRKQASGALRVRKFSTTQFLAHRGDQEFAAFAGGHGE